MRSFIRTIQAMVFVYLIWSAVTGVLITLSSGETVEWERSWNWRFGGMEIGDRITGLAGEPDFAPPLRVLTFLNRVLFVYAFYRLWRMFGGFARKAYFAERTISDLRAFTGLFVLFTLSRLAIEFTHYAVQNVDSGVFNASAIYDLGYPALFFIIAHILNEARKNAEELDTYF